MPEKKSNDGNSLSFGSVGKDVASLHQVIIALGIEIDEDELNGQRFGETTKEAIRRLQLLTGLEPTGVIDQQISGLLRGAHERLKINPSEKDTIEQADLREYCIEGNVIDLDGMPLAEATVVAVVCNLRERNEIGQYKTDSQGYYRICCPLSEVKQKSSIFNEKTVESDLQLKVISQTGETLYTSDVFFHVKSGANIPISLGGATRAIPSEFTSLRIALGPHLGDLHPEDFIEDEHFQDITLLAGKTGFSKIQIAFYSVATRLAGSTELPTEFFYGLFSQNVPPRASVIVLASTSKGVDFNFNTQKLLNLILSTSDTVLAKGIEIAISKNIISTSYESRVQSDLKRLEPLRISAALSATWGKTPIKKVFDSVAIHEEKQRNFMKLYSAKTGSSEDFWKDLSNNNDFSKDEVETLRFTTKIGVFTKGHLPLINKIDDMRKKDEIKDSSDLARLSFDGWRTLLNSSFNGQIIGVPANISGKTDQDKINDFAHMLERNFERVHPTIAFSARLGEDENIPFILKDKTTVVKFLDVNQNFDLINTNVDRYLKDNPNEVADTERETLRETLNICKRSIRLASRYAAAKPLLSDGIHSSQQVYRMGRSQFVQKYKNHPEIGASQAEAIYENAEKTYAFALSLAMNMNVGILGNNPIAIGNINPWLVVPETNKKEFPNLETLFGSLDFCACDQSRTVLSPAAYLVDMLHFLSHRTANMKSDKALDLLLKRRPDLVHIKLNSNNTNVVLPYIDLVNELLEEAVAPPEFYQDTPTALTRQTTLTTEELNANPQYVNKYAYENLANPEKAIFPWSLPFDLPLNEARLYLGQIGVDRVQLMRTFSKTPKIPSQKVIDIAIEGLLLSKAEADIITGMTGKLPWDFWNLKEDTNDINDPVDQNKIHSGNWLDVLSNIRILISRSGITYKVLTQLLNTVFVNPKRLIQLSNDPLDSCSLGTMTIGDTKLKDSNALVINQDIETLDRLHRFIRLMRRLNWDVYTLDSAITSLQADTEGLKKLNTTLLRQLYAIKTAMKRFQIPENVAIALFGQIETRNISDFPDFGDQQYSLYYKLFQNRTILNPVDPVFDLNEEGTEVRASNIENFPMLSDHKPTLIGAFQTTDADLTLSFNLLPDRKLNLSNLSTLHRHFVLANCLGLTLKELISLKALFETEQAEKPYDIFDATRPELLEVFCDTVYKIRNTRFSITALDYLLRHKFDKMSGIVPDDVTVGTLLKSILDSLSKLAAENTFIPDPTGKETRKRLASLLNPEDVDSIMAILSEKPATDPKHLIKSCLGPYMDGSDAETNLIGGNALKSIKERFEYVLKGLLTYILRSQGTGIIVQQLSNALGIPITTTAAFVTEWFPSEKDAAKKMLDDFLILLDVEREDPSKNNNPITLIPEENGIIKTRSGANISKKQLVPFSLYFKYYIALDKAANVVNGFGFSSDEIDWLHKNGISQGWLDLAKLPLSEQSTSGGRFIQWNRLADAAAIKRTLPYDGTPFTSLMDLACNNADKAEYFGALIKRTQWSEQDLYFLCGSPQEGTPESSLLSLEYPKDYSSEIALAKLIPAFSLLQRLGISADVSGWIGPTVKQEQADSIKQSVKAKYSSKQWLQIAKRLRDPLREKQRDALIDYLLVNPPTCVSRWNDANDVYSYFLIDVEMSACQGTTRIVQANAAIQLFVLRCILNLENMITVDANADTDWNQWKWMNRYRLWEANRKVFLYPENWIEPSLRKDKSPFMKDLENDLLQNEVTKDTAEDAFRKYLDKLDDIARLQVAGIYEENSSNQPTIPINGGIVVTINPNAAVLDLGSTKAFTTTVNGTTNKAVEWKTNQQVGTINDQGLFIAKISGDWIVTAISKADSTKSATARVTVNSASILIDPKKASLIIGDRQQFNVTISGVVDKAVKWVLQGGGTIDDNGLFTAERLGFSWVKVISVADPKEFALASVNVFLFRPPYGFSKTVELVPNKPIFRMIHLFWMDDNQDTDHYFLERRYEKDPKFHIVARVPAHKPSNVGANHTDYVLVSEVLGSYCVYRVQAFNQIGSSDYSETYSVYFL